MQRVLQQSSLIKIVSDILVLNTGNIIRDVRSRLEYGQSVRGGIIANYKNAEYRLFKEQLNPKAGGTVDLILTGSTVEELTLKRVSEGIYQVISTDPKYASLAKKYGSEQFGITNEQRFELYRDIETVATLESLRQIWGK